jgi:hypothetical protein
MSYLRVLSARSAVVFVTQALHAESRAYPTVTDDRLLRPDAGDWLMYRRTYDGSGFSPLKHTIWQSAASWLRGPNPLLGLRWRENFSVIGRAQSASEKSLRF